MRCAEVEKTFSGAEANTTNNRMELMAALQGLKRLRRPSHVKLVTDSQYLRLGMTTWIHNWQRQGWQKSDRKPVKNADLWLSRIKCSGTGSKHTVAIQTMNVWINWLMLPQQG